MSGIARAEPELGAARLDLRLLGDLLAGDVGCEAPGFFVHVTAEEVAEEAEAGQDSEGGGELDLDGARELGAPGRSSVSPRASIALRP